MVRFTPAAVVVLAFIALGLPTTHAFAPSSFTVGKATTTHSSTISSLAQSQASTKLNMVDPAQLTNDATNFLSTFGTDDFLSFTDQGQNLAGIFFQASLLPYLAFLYFLSFRGNRMPELANFGFQFLLVFVISTIPSGIITKGSYGLTLADCDWLHGGAELLLTITNIMIVLGFREAMSTPKEEIAPSWKFKAGAAATAVAFFSALAFGPGLGVEGHSAFLLGAGNLPADMTEALPWVS